MDVELYVYDLTQGLARQMSAPLLGTHIDAVYHTALVFGGIEYFFGAGVQTTYPGATQHGQPMERIPMGTTHLEMEVILEYLESLRTIYTPESYDLFLHNCNNFTNDFAMFLVGRGIPDHITSLPQTVLNTPFGQILRPQLDSAMRGITQAPVPSSASHFQSQVTPSTNGSTRPVVNGLANRPKSVPASVRNVTRLQEFDELMSLARESCSVVFFTSSTCAPCKIVYPTYDELAMEAGNKAILIKVDLAYSHEIASRYKVRATPTFMTFLHGEKVDEWSGANPGQLKSNVQMLLQMAHPPHPHSNLRLPTLQRPHQKFVSYSKVPPLEKLIAKLGPAGKDPSVRALKEFITTRSSDVASATLPLLSDVGKSIVSLLDSSPPASVFPMVDLFRIALVDPRISGYFAEEESNRTVLAVLDKVIALGEDCPYALRIVTLQMACNLFTSPLYPPKLLGDPSLSSPLIQLVTSSLLDTFNTPVRVSATSLAFNMAAFNHLQRLEQKEDLLPEGAQVELVASLVESLGRETESKEGVKGLIFALGLLAYCCSTKGEVKDLLEALETKKVVKSKAEMVEGEKGLVKDVLEVVG